MSFTVTQVYVTEMAYGSILQYYRAIEEFQGSTQLCFVTNGILAEHLFVDVETTHSTNNGAYLAATGKL